MTMRGIAIVIGLLAAALLPWAAHAQSANIYCLTSTSSTGAPTWAPCPATGQLPTLGYGSLAVTGSSATITNIITAGPGSVAWPPAATNKVWIINPTGSGGTVYVCPIGSTPTCTTNGVPVPAGSAYGFANVSVTMTVIGGTSLTAAVQW
jgi:hypothetical protein